MALDDSYLTDGTVSVANGATTYTFTDVGLIVSGVREGDKFIKAGHTIVFTADPASETEIEGEAWPGTTLTDATYRIEFLADGSRLTAKLQELLTAIGGSGNVDALAGLIGAADKLAYFTGPGAMDLADFTADARDLLTRWTRATAAGPSSLAFFEDTDNGAHKVNLKAAASLAGDIDFVMDANGADLLQRWTMASAASQSKLAFGEDTDNGANTLTLQGPAALGGNRTVTLPDADMTFSAFMAGLMSSADSAGATAALDALYPGSTVEFTLADNTALSLTVPLSPGVFMLTRADNSSPRGFAFYRFRAQAAASAYIENALTSYTGTAPTTTTGVLSGTTGVDGALTVSAHSDGKLYVENRLGATAQFRIRFL